MIDGREAILGRETSCRTRSMEKASVVYWLDDQDLCFQPVKFSKDQVLGSNPHVVLQYCRGSVWGPRDYT